MNDRLYWQRLLPLVWNEDNTVVFRCTTGDSEWVDRSEEVFRLLCRPEPWEIPDDATGNIFDVYGDMPNEAPWISEDNSEPGRIVFKIPKSATKMLNPKHGRYYCRILSRDKNSASDPWKTEFMGFFEVFNGSDRYIKNKEMDYA